MKTANQSNLANDLSKASQTAKGRQSKAIASEGTKLGLSAEGITLAEKQVKAGKIVTSVLASRKKDLSKLRYVGNVLVETRLKYSASRIFREEINKMEGIKDLSRQEVYNLMELSTHWVGIQKAIKDGKIANSVSPRTLGDSYKAYKAKELKENSKNVTQEKDQTQSSTVTETASTKQAVDDAIASPSIPTPTEDSIANDITKLILTNELDLDLIIAKIRATLEIVSAVKGS